MLEQTLRSLETRLTAAHEELLVERMAVKHLRTEAHGLAEKETRAAKEVNYLESLMGQYEAQLVRLESREAGLMAALRSLVVGVTIWSCVHHHRTCLAPVEAGRPARRGRPALRFLETDMLTLPVVDMATEAVWAIRRPASSGPLEDDEEAVCGKIARLDGADADTKAERIEVLEIEAEEEEVKGEDEKKGEAEMDGEIEEQMEEEEEEDEDCHTEEEEVDEEEITAVLEQVLAEKEEQVALLQDRLSAMAAVAATQAQEVARLAAEAAEREERARTKIEELEESLANVRNELELVSINLGEWSMHMLAWVRFPLPPILYLNTEVLVNIQMKSTLIL